MRRYVLDACALLAVLYGEKGTNIVKTAFDEADKGNAKIIMHKANLMEVYYDLFRNIGKEKADAILSEIKERSLEVNDKISDEFFEIAGRLKATYKISFVDSFALAQAKISGGTLLTTDHHEFDAIEGNEGINFEWVR